MGESETLLKGILFLRWALQGSGVFISKVVLLWRPGFCHLLAQPPLWGHTAFSGSWEATSAAPLQLFLVGMTLVPLRNRDVSFGLQADGPHFSAIRIKPTLSKNFL